MPQDPNDPRIQEFYREQRQQDAAGAMAGNNADVQQLAKINKKLGLDTAMGPATGTPAKINSLAGGPRSFSGDPSWDRGMAMAASIDPALAGLGGEGVEAIGGALGSLLKHPQIGEHVAAAIGPEIGKLAKVALKSVTDAGGAVASKLKGFFPEAGEDAEVASRKGNALYKRTRDVVNKARKADSRPAVGKGAADEMRVKPSGRKQAPTKAPKATPKAAPKAPKRGTEAPATKAVTKKMTKAAKAPAKSTAQSSLMSQAKKLGFRGKKTVTKKAKLDSDTEE